MWRRQAIDKMKYIPPFPMKKLSLIVLLLISFLSAFAKEQEEASDEISVDEALKNRVGCPHTIKEANPKEGSFKYVLDGRIIDKKDFGDIDIKDIKGMELVATNTYYDYIFIRTKKGSRLSKQIPKTMKELGISEYNYRDHKYKIDK